MGSLHGFSAAHWDHEPFCLRRRRLPNLLLAGRASARQLPNRLAVAWLGQLACFQPTVHGKPSLDLRNQMRIETMNHPKRGPEPRRGGLLASYSDFPLPSTGRGIKGEGWLHPARASDQRRSSGIFQTVHGSSLASEPSKRGIGPPEAKAQSVILDDGSHCSGRCRRGIPASGTCHHHTSTFDPRQPLQVIELEPYLNGLGMLAMALLPSFEPLVFLCGGASPSRFGISAENRSVEND